MIVTVFYFLIVDGKSHFVRTSVCRQADIPDVGSTFDFTCHGEPWCDVPVKVSNITTDNSMERFFVFLSINEDSL